MNKKGVSLVSNKLVLIIIGIVVLVSVLFFIFKADLTKYINFLPDYEYEDGKESSGEVVDQGNKYGFERTGWSQQIEIKITDGNNDFIFLYWNSEINMAVMRIRPNKNEPVFFNDNKEEVFFVKDKQKVKDNIDKNILVLLTDDYSYSGLLNLGGKTKISYAKYISDYMEEDYYLNLQNILYSEKLEDNDTYKDFIDYVLDIAKMKDVKLNGKDYSKAERKDIIKLFYGVEEIPEEVLKNANE